MKFVFVSECETLPGETHHRRYWDLLEQAAFAEEMGWDVFGTSEHHFWTDMCVVPAPEVIFAAVAMRTNRIRMRHMSRLTSIVHPILLAEQLATCDIFSNGRMELCTARGNTLMQLDAFGVSLDETQERSEEALEVIIKALSQTSFSHEGKHWGPIPERNLTPRCVQEPHPPLYKICQSPASADRAARQGLGCITSDLYQGWDVLEQMVAAYKKVGPDEVEPVGRATPVSTVGALIITACVDETNEDAIRRSERNLIHFSQMLINDLYVQLAERSELGYGYLEELRKLRDHSGDARWLRDHTPSVLIGDPDYCIEQIRQMEELGLDEVIVRVDGERHAENMRNLEWFGRYIIPAFKMPKNIVTGPPVGFMPDADAKPSYESTKPSYTSSSQGNKLAGKQEGGLN